ncbi:MAG: hypothetical protein HY658_09450, partial [Actinobacteria bacterium]|nr:hypothetical protein [Actinomycetota bacterium]
MDVRLRAARPEDAEAAARLILEPPPSLTLLLGSEEAALRAARASFLAPRSIHSWRHALVADDPEAGVVGLVVAFPGGLWGRYRAPTGLAMARAAPKALPGLVRRGRVLDRLTAPVPEDALHVSTLAVAPGTRGRGIGATLLRAA